MTVRPGLVAVETTQWIIALGSIGSALIALALALGLKDWFFRPRVRLPLRHARDPATWRLEHLVCGDNIREHFLVDGPHAEIARPSEAATQLGAGHA